MTLLDIVVLSTFALVACLLWLEHREELVTSARIRNDEHFSTEGRIGRIWLRSFDDDTQRQIAYELRGNRNPRHIGGHVHLPNTLNSARPGYSGRDFRQCSELAPSGREGALDQSQSRVQEQKCGLIQPF
jgi:hypothetical protein